MVHRNGGRDGLGVPCPISSVDSRTHTHFFLKVILWVFFPPMSYLRTRHKLILPYKPQGVSGNGRERNPGSRGVAVSKRRIGGSGDWTAETGLGAPGDRWNFNLGGVPVSRLLGVGGQHRPRPAGPTHPRGLRVGPVHAPWPGLRSWGPAEQTTSEAASETRWVVAPSCCVADEAVVTPPL